MSRPRLLISHSTIVTLKQKKVKANAGRTSWLRTDLLSNYIDRHKHSMEVIWIKRVFI